MENNEFKLETRKRRRKLKHRRNLCPKKKKTNQLEKQDQRRNLCQGGKNETKQTERRDSLWLMCPTEGSVAAKKD